MTKATKIFIIILLIMVASGGSLIYFANKQRAITQKDAGSDFSFDENGTVAGVSTEDIENKNYAENLAKYMTEKGMIMYGAYWCPHCQDQKKLFGQAIQYVDYVECDVEGPSANPDECNAMGITSYPTWIFQGKQYKGSKSLSELARLVGFSQ